MRCHRYHVRERLQGADCDRTLLLFFDVRFRLLSKRHEVFSCRASSTVYQNQSLYAMTVPYLNPNTR